MDFFKTKMGHQLIERDIPKISVALERIAASLESILKMARIELGVDDETKTGNPSDTGPPWSST